MIWRTSLNNSCGKEHPWRKNAPKWFQNFAPKMLQNLPKDAFKSFSKVCTKSFKEFFQSLLHEDGILPKSATQRCLLVCFNKSPSSIQKHLQVSSNKWSRKLQQGCYINLQGLFKLCSEICSKSAPREDPKSVQKGSSSLLKTLL